MRPAVTTALALVAGAVLLTGCSGSAPASVAAASSPAPSAAAAAPTEPGCPTATAEATTEARAWPDVVPADLPQPPTTTVTDVQERTDGLTVIMFTTATSIRDSVLFLVEKLPAAGYTLARGDAENTEADAPFVKGGLRGVMRMVAVEPCRTDWLMALTSGATIGTSPLLPTRPSASPLPFG